MSFFYQKKQHLCNFRQIQKRHIFLIFCSGGLIYAFSNAILITSVIPRPKKGINKMGIKLGLVGLGLFGSQFAKLFKAHPAVGRIGLCDCEAEKLKRFSEDPFMQDKLSSRDIYTSLDDICKADFDALVIITQPWLHAPQCIQALESG
jgi:hypothetical protein